MEFLSQHGVPFTARNVVEDSTARDELTQRTGRLSIPVIVVDEEIVVGFDRKRLETLLELA